MMEFLKNFKYKSLLLLLGSLIPGIGMAQAENGEQSATTGMDPTAFWILIIIGFFLLLAIIIVADAIKNLLKNKNLWKYRGPGGTAMSLLVGLSLSLISSGAQGATGEGSAGPSFFTETSFWILAGLDVILLLIVGYLLQILKGLIRDLRQPVEEEGVVMEKRKREATWLSKAMKKLTDSTPVEREEEIVLAHEHDGIQELDNNLPPWWKWLFYLSIVFSVVYVFHYHILGTGDTQIEEYKKEMKAAEARIAAYKAKQKLNVDASSVTIVEEEGRLDKGKAIYKEHCVQCHGDKGQGGVGPNMTDKYWIHGGSIKDVFSTIKDGVPSKGMISWESQLNPVQMQNVASYILVELQGNEVEGEKEPEGDLYEPEGKEKEEEEKPNKDKVKTKTDTVKTATLK